MLSCTSLRFTFYFILPCELCIILTPQNVLGKHMLTSGSVAAMGIFGLGEVSFFKRKLYLTLNA